MKKMIFTIWIMVLISVTAVLAQAGSVVFEDVQYAVDRGDVSIKARLLDSGDNPLASKDVRIFCRDHEIATAVSDEDGVFRDNDVNCAPGQDLWVEIEHNNETYRQSFIRVLGGSSTYGKTFSASMLKNSKNLHGKGVPEFSAVTLSIAVIAGCLGLALLRKD